MAARLPCTVARWDIFGLSLASVTWLHGTLKKDPLFISQGGPGENGGALRSV